MNRSKTEYGAIGVGACKNVSVEIDQALDESHYLFTVALSSETVPIYFSLQMHSLRTVRAVLEFLSDHIGKPGFHEQEIPVSEHLTLILVKDSEFIDRFFLKLFGPDLFIAQTFGGISAASLTKALVLALDDTRNEPESEPVV